MNLHISHLKKYYDKTTKIFYYYSDRLLKDDILIKFKSDEFLSVAILDHKNAQEFIMTSGSLAPVQYRRIIKDILSIHELTTKVGFTQTIRELAVVFVTGRKQETKELAEAMFSQLVWELTLIERVEMDIKETSENENQTLNS